jgi:hypothetical protein
MQRFADEKGVGMLMKRLGLQLWRTPSNLWFGSVMALICFSSAIDYFVWDKSRIVGIATLMWGIGSLFLAYDGYLVRLGDDRRSSRPIQAVGILMIIALLVWSLAE